MRVTSTGLTDVGQKRDNNQDSLLINKNLRLYIVADGMGGHAGGETASRLTVETIEERLLSIREKGSSLFDEKTDLPESRLPDFFRESVEAACYTVFQAAREHPHLEGMGTTVTALLLHESTKKGVVDAFLAHVGDSRVYLVRNNIVQQVSEDHSLVNEQIKAGVLTEEEAKISRFKNIITRSVGFEEDVLVDVMGLWAEPGDIFIMCSDGLSNYMDGQEIFEHVKSHADDNINNLPQTLINIANERGGDDNITVLVVRVDEV